MYDFHQENVRTFPFKASYNKINWIFCLVGSQNMRFPHSRFSSQKLSKISQLGGNWCLEFSNCTSSQQIICYWTIPWSHKRLFIKTQHSVHIVFVSKKHILFCVANSYHHSVNLFSMLYVVSNDIIMWCPEKFCMKQTQT